MAASRLQPPTHRLLLTLSITLVVTVYLDRAVGFNNDGFSDVEVKRKCGFSLTDIHDCKYQRCQEASAICAAKTAAAQGIDLTDCQIEYCMDGKKECEKPLNKYLSEAEKCEGDEFNEVEKNCLSAFRKSANELTACKRDGYLKKKVFCFEAEWKLRIDTYAYKVMKETASPAAIDCAYEFCFQNVTTCLYDHHHELATNPASKRKFDLEHCAYVAVDYAHECESVDSISGCKDKLTFCINENRETNFGGGANCTGAIVGGVFGSMAVTAGVLIGIACYKEWIKCPKCSRSSSEDPVPQATNPQATNPRATNLQATNAPSTNVQEAEDSHLLDNPTA